VVNDDIRAHWILSKEQNRANCSFDWPGDSYLSYLWYALTQ